MFASAAYYRAFGFTRSFSYVKEINTYRMQIPHEDTHKYCTAPRVAAPLGTTAGAL
jgi:hypothetical protein